MRRSAQPVTIKRYAPARLYDVRVGRHIADADTASMTGRGAPAAILGAATGGDVASFCFIHPRAGQIEPWQNPSNR
jgi:polyhydroxyalkanoate synthesis regulator protein